MIEGCHVLLHRYEQFSSLTMKSSRVSSQLKSHQHARFYFFFFLCWEIYIYTFIRIYVVVTCLSRSLRSVRLLIFFINKL